MRVSTDTEKQSTDLQYDALLSAEVDERHIYEDHGSGVKADRPGLRECLDYLKPGDTLVVWKLDRLGRSLPHLLNVVGSLREKQVGFRSLTENIDTNTIQGDLLFNIFGALAQFERALIVERVNAGLASAARRGEHGGRPRAIEGEKLEQIIAALENGASKAAVCRTFNLKRTTLIDTLKRVGWVGRAESNAQHTPPTLHGTTHG